MLTLVVVALISLFIGLSKGGMGAALVLLATPLLSLVMPVQQAVSTVLPLLIIADALALWMYWKKWDIHYVRLLTPMAVVGVVIGTFLLANLPDLVLRRTLGLFTVAFIIYKLFGARLTSMNYTERPWHGWLAGGASGLGSALANSGAPPFTAYMLLQNVEPVIFVGTTTLFFAIVNLLKLPGLIIADILHWGDVLSVAWALPLLVAGVGIGRWLVPRMNRVVFEYVMLAVLGVAAVVLLFTVPS